MDYESGPSKRLSPDPAAHAGRPAAAPGVTADEAVKTHPRSRPEAP